MADLHTKQSNRRLIDFLEDSLTGRNLQLGGLRGQRCHLLSAKVTFHSVEIKAKRDY